MRIQYAGDHAKSLEVFKYLSVGRYLNHHLTKPQSENHAFKEGNIT